MLGRRLTLGAMVATLAATRGCGASAVAPIGRDDAGPIDGTVRADAAGAARVDATTNDAAVCNALPVPPLLVVHQQPSPEPSPLGGTIREGTWDLVDDTIYTGSGGVSGPLGGSYGSTLVIASDSLTSIQYIHDLAPFIATETDTWSVLTETNELSTLASCPFPGYFSGTASYTATATRLMLYWADAEIRTYALRR